MSEMKPDLVDQMGDLVEKMKINIPKGTGRRECNTNLGCAKSHPPSLSSLAADAARSRTNLKQASR